MGRAARVFTQASCEAAGEAMGPMNPAEDQLPEPSTRSESNRERMSPRHGPPNMTPSRFTGPGTKDNQSGDPVSEPDIAARRAVLIDAELGGITEKYSVVSITGGGTKRPSSGGESRARTRGEDAPMRWSAAAMTPGEGGTGSRTASGRVERIKVV